MKNILIGLVAAVAAMVLIAGCETESADQISITITPNNATIQKEESREFTASGWRDYTWSLTDPSIGVLSVTKGDRTTYTAIKGPTSTNETFPQILTLTINVPADNSSSTTTSTNTVPDPTGLVTAQAWITHVYIP